MSAISRSQTADSVKLARQAVDNERGVVACATVHEAANKIKVKATRHATYSSFLCSVCFFDGHGHHLTLEPFLQHNRRRHALDGVGGSRQLRNWLVRKMKRRWP